MIRRTLTPESVPKGEQVQQRQKHWLNILFLSLTPVIGIFGTLAYAIAFGVTRWEPALFFTLFGLVGFSVTADDRCFGHKACVRMTLARAGSDETSPGARNRRRSPLAIQ